jgi:DNA-binding LytR/AlgR family response regulator
LRINWIYEDREDAEIVIHCREGSREAQMLSRILEQPDRKIPGISEQGTILFMPEEVLYFESVDANIYAYLETSVARVAGSLEKLENRYRERGFFRASRSVLLNLNAVSAFQRSIGDRMTAVMNNGEKIVISRHYAKVLRSRLKEGGAV